MDHNLERIANPPYVVAHVKDFVYNADYNEAYQPLQSKVTEEPVLYHFRRK